MYFFTGDEHFQHSNILKPDYANRPFKNVEEMDREIIRRHNKVVSKNDIVIHLGDFTLKNSTTAAIYIEQLKGNHVFLRGSHDSWLSKKAATIWERKIEGQYIVCCHYAMRTWARSYYNSWNLFGHSHGKLEGVGKQFDVGVDTNNFYPYSFEQVKNIMEDRPDNFDYIDRKRG